MVWLAASACVFLLVVSISSSYGGTYPSHTVNATCFWVNEPADSAANAGISNVPSAFDANWGSNFFGVYTNGTCGGGAAKCCIEMDPTTLTGDNSLVNNYQQCTPANGYNPYYFALPYYDFGSSDWNVCCAAGGGCVWGGTGATLDERRFNRAPATGDTNVGVRKPGVSTYIPWYNEATSQQLADSTYSLAHHRWIAVTNLANSVTCYGQWEDVGPFGEADDPYVFGTEAPICTINGNAALDLSPTLIKCIGLDSTSGNAPANSQGLVQWQFIDYVDVPTGPWKNNVSGSSTSSTSSTSSSSSSSTLSPNFDFLFSN